MDVSAIKKQVEYYLSDDNLQKDEFFNTEFRKPENNGFLPIKLLLNCNNIKKLGVKSEEEIIKSLESTELVEVNEKRDAIRRKGIFIIPDLIVKKRKLDCEQDTQKEFNPAQNIDFEPLIFTISTEKQGIANWKILTEALSKQYNLNPPYVRFGKLQGNFAIDSKLEKDESVIKLLADGLALGEDLAQVQITEGEDLKKFWELHGNHFRGIQERKQKENSVRSKQEDKQKKQAKARKGFTFADEKYTDINTLKNIFKTIMARAGDDDAIKEPHHSMILELLKNHENFEAKSKDLKHFTVGVHPVYKDTRCFFAVRTDGTKEDFSFTKCLKQLEDKITH